MRHLTFAVILLACSYSSGQSLSDLPTYEPTSYFARPTCTASRHIVLAAQYSKPAKPRNRDQKREHWRQENQAKRQHRKP
jgi:hypothetical protein